MNHNFVEGDAGAFSVPMTLLNGPPSVDVRLSVPAVNGMVVLGSFVFFLGLALFFAASRLPGTAKKDRESRASLMVLGLILAFGGAIVSSYCWGKSL